VTHDASREGEPGAAVSRRRLLTAGGGLALVGGLAAVSAVSMLGGRPEPAPPLLIDDATLRDLTALSATLCGGGTFAPEQAVTLLNLLAADDRLRQGFVDLTLEPPVAGVAQERSPEAEAAMQAILRFWYVGSFDGQPIADRGTAYYQLTAWQAMYTPPYAVCKAYGAWADAPEDEPEVPAL
jgi:hypothetical protein